jgi:aspartate/methionine/tyrosine aminotransferase
VVSFILLLLTHLSFVISAHTFPLSIPNITFSPNFAALAGLRVGYGAFPLGMIDYLWRAKQPYNVSVAAEVAGCAALTNMDYMHKVGAPGH